MAFRLVWLTIFGVAFGYLEAAVVVYLRALYYPEGFAFPLAVPENSVLLVELGREFATLLMLWAVAMISSKQPWDRFGAFCLLFGIWDLVFYLALRVMLAWPESLLTWDVLFLIPLVWSGPVLSPVLIAVSLVVAGVWILVLGAAGVRPVTAWWVWMGAGLALVLLLGAFMANHRMIRAGEVPESFPWGVYWAGILLGWSMFGLAIRRKAGHSAEVIQP